VPTFAADDRFWREYEGLSVEHAALFKEARDEFIAILKEYEARGCPGIPKFPKKLGVTPMVGRPGIMEFAWAPDGRCTRSYGTPQRTGCYHIIWRRIGTHSVYNDP
jgi:hypothetical protein